MAIDTTYGGKDHLLHLHMMMSDAMAKLNLLDGDHDKENYINMGTVGTFQSTHDGLFIKFNLTGTDLACFYMDCITATIEALVKCPLCGLPVEEWKRKSWEDYFWTGFNCDDECIDADEMGFYFLFGFFDYPVDKEYNPIFKLEGYQPFIDEVIKQKRAAGDHIPPIKQTPVTE